MLTILLSCALAGAPPPVPPEALTPLHTLHAIHVADQRTPVGWMALDVDPGDDGGAVARLEVQMQVGDTWRLHTTHVERYDPQGRLLEARTHETRHGPQPDTETVQDGTAQVRGRRVALTVDGDRSRLRLTTDHPVVGPALLQHLGRPGTDRPPPRVTLLAWDAPDGPAWQEVTLTPLPDASLSALGHTAQGPALQTRIADATEDLALRWHATEDGAGLGTVALAGGRRLVYRPCPDPDDTDGCLARLPSPIRPRQVRPVVSRFLSLGTRGERSREGLEAVMDLERVAADRGITVQALLDELLAGEPRSREAVGALVMAGEVEIAPPGAWFRVDLPTTFLHMALQDQADGLRIVALRRGTRTDDGP